MLIKPLQVLVFGPEAGAASVVESLGHQGDELRLLTVHERAAFLEALHSLRWGVIVCFHAPGERDALVALNQAREEAPRTPCVVVAELEAEAVLMACARAGAADCVSTRRLDRLREVVRRAALEPVGPCPDVVRVVSPSDDAPDAESGLLDTLPYPAWRAGRDGKCIHFNAAWLEFTGRRLDQELGQGWLSGVHPDDQDRCITVHWRAFARRQPYTAEYRLRRHDGAYRWVIDLGRPVLEGETVVGFLGFCLDITERRQAEEAMRESVAALRSLLNATSDAALLLDVDGNVLAANEMAGTRLGVPAEDLLGMSVQELLPAPVGDVRMLQIGAVLQSGRPSRFEDEVSGVWYENTIYPMCDPAGAVTGVALFEREITAYRRVEQALRDSERSYRQLFETAGDAGLIVDPDTDAILEVNLRATELYGLPREQLLALTWAGLAGPGGRPLDREPGLGEGGGSRVFDTTHVRQDGCSLRLRVSASVVEFAGRQAVLCLSRDLTDEAALTAQERRQRKVEALENLAGEVAACFDQLLEELLGAVRSSGSHLERDGGAQRRRDVEGGLLRGRRLARQLLLFARREPGMPERLDVDDLLAESVELATRLRRPEVRVAVASSAPGLAVTADHEQILQALAALVSNAVEAMPGPGCITLGAVATPDGRVVMSVADEGQGVPDALQAHLFEPFVTTHGDRWGVGLGLAMAHGIVTQHGGTLEVASRAGGGTVARIALPRALGDASGVKRWAELVPPPAT